MWKPAANAHFFFYLNSDAPNGILMSEKIMVSFVPAFCTNSEQFINF